MRQFKRYLALIAGAYTGLVLFVVFIVAPLATAFTLLALGFLTVVGQSTNADLSIIFSSSITTPVKVLVLTLFGGLIALIFKRLMRDRLDKPFDSNRRC